MFWVRFRSSLIIAVCAVLALVLGGNVLFGVILLVSLTGMMEMYRVAGAHRALPGIIGYLACAAYNLRLPNFLPTRYAQVSDPHDPIKTSHTRYAPPSPLRSCQT